MRNYGNPGLADATRALKRDMPCLFERDVIALEQDMRVADALMPLELTEA